jgi:tetratricopeptide (TPR) repeat protein
MKRMILTATVVLAASVSGLFAQAPAPAQKDMKPKSAAERKAVMAIQTASTAGDQDGIIKASEDLIAKYADSDYKEYALQAEANAYKMKGDKDQARVVAEHALQVDPKNFTMEILVGDIITPNIKKFDLDKDKEIADATHLYSDAIENAKDAAKPSATISDADWESNKKFSIAQAHNGLAMVAQVQEKWDDAIKEYQLAVDGDPEQDAYATRLANAYLGAGKKKEAIEVCDKLLAKPNLHPAIKSVVTNIKSQASQ